MSPHEPVSDGEAPAPGGERRAPFHALLGLRTLEAGGGRGRLELVVKEHHLRTLGILHGGVFAALLDAVMGMAASTSARGGDDVVTVQLNVNFLRPAALGEALVAAAEVLHAGRRTAVARGEVRTASGELAALGSGTFMFLPPTGVARGGIGPVGGGSTPDAGAR